MIPIDDDEAPCPAPGTLGTEGADRRYRGLDSWPTRVVLEALWAGQSRAVSACLEALPALERAVDGAVERLAGSTGRLIYVGAGSSGMIAALDALDLGATFNWPEARTLVFIAGGLDVGPNLVRGPDPLTEDDAAAGRDRAREAQLCAADVVVGLSASGSSAYTVAVLEEARRRGAMTVAVTSRADSPAGRAADHAVVMVTGPEVIAGSTRLGAGTAQKLVLNLLSTTVMVGLGSVFDNFMIDLRPANAKLRQRQVAIVATIAEVDAPAAADALAGHGDVKRAVLGLAGLSASEIDAALSSAGGNLRTALDRARSKDRTDRGSDRSARSRTT
jgi:N-acetylmuramic acid 6-phosphate etherase